MRQTFPSIAHRFYAESEPRLEAGRQVLQAHAREMGRIADEQDRQNPYRRDAAMLAALAEKPVPASGSRETLHDALTAWGEAMEQRYQQDGKPTETGRKFRDMSQRLKRAHTDVLLSELTYSRVEAMTDYWCARPEARNARGEGKGRAVSVQTVKNTLKNLRRFLRWLHRSDEFAWRDADRIIEDATAARPISTMLTAQERKKIAAGPDAWTLEELKALYRFATERDRLLLLLGLNGGFVNGGLNVQRSAGKKCSAGDEGIVCWRG